MAAVESYQFEEVGGVEVEPYLRLVAIDPTPMVLRRGPSLATRRAARGRMLQRRRRTGVAALLIVGLVVLAWPGHAFGGTTGAGLSNDLASSSTLASGMVYVVQPGDSVDSIARDMNPVDPSMARALLVHELESSTVIVGEHVLIP
jgi:hypothetical protein